MKIWPKCAWVWRSSSRRSFFGTGERLLMAVHHAGGILFHRAQGDETFAHQPLAGIGHREFLEVRKDPGFRSRASTPASPESRCAAARV